MTRDNRVTHATRAKNMTKAELDKLARERRKREDMRKAAKRDIAVYLNMNALSRYSKEYERDTLRLLRMR